MGTVVIPEIYIPLVLLGFLLALLSTIYDAVVFKGMAQVANAPAPVATGPAQSELQPSGQTQEQSRLKSTPVQP